MLRGFSISYHARSITTYANCFGSETIALAICVHCRSGAILYIGTDLKLSTVQQELIVGSLNLIAAFGGLIAGKVTCIIPTHVLSFNVIQRRHSELFL
jgi:L-asparaginase II